MGEVIAENERSALKRARRWNTVKRNTTLKNGADKCNKQVKTTGSASEPVVWDYLQMTINKGRQLGFGQSAYFLSSYGAIFEKD